MSVGGKELQKSVNIRALKVFSIERYFNFYDETKIEIERRTDDAWVEFTLHLKEGVELPPSGDDFDLKSICEDYEVLNIADELEIDDDIVSDVPEELEEIANDALESYEFESWDVSEANFYIEEYELI